MNGFRLTILRLAIPIIALVLGILAFASSRAAVPGSCPEVCDSCGSGAGRGDGWYRWRSHSFCAGLCNVAARTCEKASFLGRWSSAAVDCRSCTRVQYRRFFDAVGPEHREACGHILELGTGDEAKFACASELPRLRSAPCTVISVGSMGLWAFEQAMAKLSACAIHTFDCTGTWEPPAEIADRVTFHELCIGAAGVAGQLSEEQLKSTISWSEALALVGVAEVEYVKLDIEGGEWGLLPAIVEGPAPPKQLQIELHTAFRPRLPRPVS